MIVDGLGPADVIDADDQRPEILKRAKGAQVDQRQTHGHQGHQHKRDLQVGIGHHGVAILFEVQTLGVLKAAVVAHGTRLPSSPAEEPPAVPLKMWLVSRKPQQSVDRSQERDEQDRELFDELHGRDSPDRLQAEDAQDQVADDEDDGCRNDLIKTHTAQSSGAIPRTTIRVWAR